MLEVVPSISSIGAAPLTETERQLRNTCTAWSYQRCSSVVTNCNMITKFCGRCTRCRVIFNSETIAEREAQLQGTNSMVTSQIPSPELLQDIADSYNFKNSLQEIMTDQGKKILKAAVVLNHKLVSKLQFSQKEQSLLGRVIGVLTECNTARIAPVQDQISATSTSIVFVDDYVNESSCSYIRQDPSSDVCPPFIDDDSVSCPLKAPKIKATDYIFNMVMISRDKFFSIYFYYIYTR